MNRLLNLSLIIAAMFLASCDGNNNRAEIIHEYNVTYKIAEGDPSAVSPEVTGPNTIKSNEEKLVTLVYAESCAPVEQVNAISAFDNISVKDYQQINNNKATFKIYEATADVVITLFKINL